MPKTKPDVAEIHLTYDELETALIALALRQEELRGARARHFRDELEMIWNVSNKLDSAQRFLEDKLSAETESWLQTIIDDEPREAPTRQERQPHPRESWLSKLSRLTRL